MMEHVQQAKKLLESEDDEKPFTETEFTGVKSVMVKCARQYVALSEAELKKELKLNTKIPKVITNKLPSLVIPGRAGCLLCEPPKVCTHNLP